MNALPYVDLLIKEYLLFRGFTRSIQAFNADIGTDRGRGFQVHFNLDHFDSTLPAVCHLFVELPHECLSFVLHSDKAISLQADQLTSFVFSKLIRHGRGRELLDLLDFLKSHVYSRLDTAYEPTIRKLQVITAVQPVPN